MQPIRVVIVDDHPVVRHGLRGMLAETEEVQVVGDASNVEEALDLIAALRPDVVLLDIRMPGTDGLWLLKRLAEREPATKVIILTNYAEEQFLLEAFRCGAYGYFLKNVSREELIHGLRTVHKGNRMLSPELIDMVLRQFAELGRQQTVDRFGLSRTELKLLKILAEGATNREIAEKMFWSETTVKRKLSEVFQKLGVSNRAQAVAVAMRHGLV
ncbi:MAG: response regulator [Anaerolineae bacterium]